jgi:hypothetical protein
MLLPYVFVVHWTSNNFDDIHFRVFQQIDTANEFRAVLNQYCNQQVQDRVEILHELLDLDFRMGDRVSQVLRHDVL